MKSIILCEGIDDLWFISYYLHKIDGWTTKNRPEQLWKYVKLPTDNMHRKVSYMRKEENAVALWSVGGKDGFEEPLNIIVNKFIKEIPHDAVDAIIIVRDRDMDAEEEILNAFAKYFKNAVSLKNKMPTQYHVTLPNGETASTTITPLIIPFDEAGAIETLLMRAMEENDRSGAIVVDSAKRYISDLLKEDSIRKKYLQHNRLILKAKYSSMVAVTNPDHSTGIFQDMILSTPWEKSPYIREHFEVILKAISP